MGVFCTDPKFLSILHLSFVFFVVFRFGAGPQFNKFRCGDITPISIMSVEATDVWYPRYVAHWRRVPLM